VSGHLVIRGPNWVGDLVMASAVLEAALRSVEGGPGSPQPWDTVTILVRKHLAPVLADGPCEPRTVAFTGSAGEVEAYARLRPDAVALFTNSLGAAWRARKAPMRIGTALSGRRALLTHAVVPPTRDGRRFPIPMPHLFRDVVGLAGIQVPDLHFRLYVRAELVERERARLARLGLAEDEPYVLCCPGAAFGAAKMWIPGHYARALDRIHEEHGLRAVVTGGPGEEPLVEAVVGGCSHAALSLANEERDLEGLKALVSGARLMVVGDSGPRFVAAAFDTPSVTVMGPSSPDLTGNSFEIGEFARVSELECAPCLQRFCPLGHHRCMIELAPEVVVAAAGRVLVRAETERVVFA